MKEEIKMAVETGSIGLAALSKFGWLKLATLGAAGLGALMMAVFRPPKTRKEMAYQAGVALGCSLLFGNFFVHLFDSWFDFVNLIGMDFEQTLQFHAGVHGLIGALSWGVFGGLAHTRDRFGSQTLNESKNDLLK